MTIQDRDGRIVPVLADPRRPAPRWRSPRPTVLRRLLWLVTGLRVTRVGIGL